MPNCKQIQTNDWLMSCVLNECEDKLTLKTRNSWQIMKQYTEYKYKLI